MPSPSNPSPGTGGFFYAGWNTWKHGSRYSGVIDASHVENYYVFMQTSNRNQYSNDLSNSIIEFMNIHYGFVMDCTAISAMEVEKNSNRKLLMTTDILGQETLYRRNSIFFYIYDDGTVEKKITIE